MKPDKPLFWKVAYTSYLSGGLAVILGVILLLLSKKDIHSLSWEWGLEKIIVGVGLIAAGIRWLWVGYQDESSFSIEGVYDPEHERIPRNFLAQRWGAADSGKELTALFHGKSFSLNYYEKAHVARWQLLFYKLISPSGIHRLFDYQPFPIGKFIARQSKPVVLLAGAFLIFAVLLFLSYLEVLPFSVGVAELNVLLLAGLLYLWRPTGMTDALIKSQQRDLRKDIAPIAVVILVAYLVYRRYETDIHVGIFLTLLLVALAMIGISFLSIRLITLEFADRKNVRVDISEGQTHIKTANKQPDVIFRHFENVLKNTIGWQYTVTIEHRNPLEKTHDAEHNKNVFVTTRVYETRPRILPREKNPGVEARLEVVWRWGTILTCLGLILFSAGFLFTGNANAIASLYFILTGTSFFFLGNKLVYEIYLFYRTEVQFESELIFFNAEGSYGEYEVIDTASTTKRKDTFTDYTADVKVCKIVTQVFVHPYLRKDALHLLPRFITHVGKHPALHEDLQKRFDYHLTDLRLES